MFQIMYPPHKASQYWKSRFMSWLLKVNVLNVYWKFGRCTPQKLHFECLGDVSECACVCVYLLPYFPLRMLVKLSRSFFVWFYSMKITGMLYILPTVVLQVEAYLYNENINKTILSFTYAVWFLYTSGSQPFWLHGSPLSTKIFFAISSWLKNLSLA